MVNLNEYIKEGLFDNIDKLEGKNGLESTSKQIEKEIKDWICSHYFDSPSIAKSRAIKKSNLTIDTSTTPPTVNYNWPGHMPCIYVKAFTESLCNNGMFQWGEMHIFEMNMDTISDIIGAPKKIKGHFIIHSGKLTSLEGAPEEIGGNFTIHSGTLKSLEGGPKVVGGDFSCARCPSLKSLNGAPKKVGGSFYCNYCPSLKTLEGGPEEVGGSFNCIDCPLLTSLKGAPKKVGGSFRVGPWLGLDCSLESLEGGPKEVGGSFDCSGCKLLKSLKGAPKVVGGRFNCAFCGVKFTEADVKKVSNVKYNIDC